MNSSTVITQRTNLNELSSDLILTMTGTVWSLQSGYNSTDIFALPPNLRKAKNYPILFQAIDAMFERASEGWRGIRYSECTPRLYHLFASTFGCVPNLVFGKSDNNDYMYALWAEQDYPPFDTGRQVETLHGLGSNYETRYLVKWNPISDPVAIKTK